MADTLDCAWSLVQYVQSHHTQLSPLAKHLCIHFMTPDLCVMTWATLNFDTVSSQNSLGLKNFCANKLLLCYR